jgi:hypothetical protein
VEEGMKGVEIIDRLNKHYHRVAPQRTQVYYWIEEVKSGRKDLSTIPPREGRQIRDWMTALGKRSKKILIFQREKLPRP